MQYNPITKTLWDEDGTLLKKVHCPRAVRPDQIAGGLCHLCDHEVVQIDQLQEKDALQCCRVRWTGSDFELLYSPEDDAQHVIG